MIDPAAIRHSRLDNGLTLVSERITTVRSASIGVWVTRGSRDEAAELNGITHFLEHMLFKGTGSRSARDIAVAIDAMGGQLDAFTSREAACYYAMVLDQHLPEAMALLADLVRDPRLAAEDLERERGVILEEISSAEDDPEDLMFETFLSRFWPGSAMGRPILGTRDTVAAFAPEQLRQLLVDIGPGDLLIAAAGNLSHHDLESMAAELFDDLPAVAERAARIAPEPRSHLAIIDSRELEQVQLYVACAAPSASAPDRYAAHVLNTLLGGSVSSRLFQSIREDHGLAYNVYSSFGAYSDCGHLWISAGTRAASVPPVFELVGAELQRLEREPIDGDELTRVKEHLKGGLMLGLENTFARMANLARQQMTFGRTFGLDEILGGIDAVNVEDVQQLAGRLFGDASLSAGLVAGREVADEMRTRYGSGLNLGPAMEVMPEAPASAAD